MDCNCVQLATKALDCKLYQTGKNWIKMVLGEALAKQHCRHDPVAHTSGRYQDLALTTPETADLVASNQTNPLSWNQTSPRPTQKGKSTQPRLKERPPGPGQSQQVPEGIRRQVVEKKRKKAGETLSNASRRLCKQANKKYANADIVVSPAKGQGSLEGHTSYASRLHRAAGS